MIQFPETLNGAVNPPTYSPAHKDPSKRTLSPIVTGTSVLAVKYNGGVVMAADTLGSYGSLARFYQLERMHKIGDSTAIGVGGEYSDYQFIVKTLQELDNEDYCRDDGNRLRPSEIWNYLCRVMYNRRNKFDPLWNSIVLAGYNKKEQKSFLGYVDLVGTCYQDDYVATGYGGYIALPLIRKAYRPDLTFEEAKKLIEDCLRVLFYRDARSYYKIQITNVNESGVTISEPYELATYNWDSGETAANSERY